MATKAAAKPKNKKISVVFVCTGNTCRSPVAERVFKSFLKKQGRLTEFKVSSVGLAAEVGSPMSRYAQEVLKHIKVSGVSHKAKALTDKMIKPTDYFICMTESHAHYIKAFGNVYTVGAITGAGDVSDPYGGDLESYQKMFEYLCYAMGDILKFIDNDTKSRV